MQRSTPRRAPAHRARPRFALALTLMLGGLAGVSHAATPAGAGDSAQLRLGRYLATRVAMCEDCHTPRGPDGRLDDSRWLQGAPIDSRPSHPHPWAARAPGIAGLPAGWSAAQVAQLLRTGQRPDGSHPLPPMPPYRMDARDAEAVAAYLASLGH